MLSSLFYILLITIFLKRTLSLNCTNLGTSLQIQIPFDKGKPTGGYLSWIENDESAKDARNYFDKITTHSNTLQKLRDTAQNFQKFKFIQITDVSDVSSTNDQLVKTITKLKPATLYNIKFHEDLNIDNNDLKNNFINHSCLVQTSESKPSQPKDLKILAKTYTTAKLQFSPPENPNGKLVKYIINYRKKNNRRSLKRGFLDVSVNKYVDLELMMTGLYPNLLYEVQVAVQNYHFTSNYTNWIEFRIELRKFKIEVPLLDHGWTPILLENEDIYTKGFKQNVAGILEQMFVKDVFSPSSVVVEGFRRRFDNNTLAIGFVYVTEQTIERLTEEFSLSFLSDLFDLNKFRYPEVAKVREISVENGIKCLSKESDCDPSAQCIEIIGKIECKCRHSFIDRSKSQLLLPGRFCDTTRKVEGFSVQAFSKTGLFVEWKEPSRILGMPVEYLIRVVKMGQKIRYENEMENYKNQDQSQNYIYDDQGQSLGIYKPKLNNFREISIAVNESLKFEHRIENLPRFESFLVEIHCVSEITPDIEMLTNPSTVKYHHGLKTSAIVFTKPSYFEVDFYLKLASSGFDQTPDNFENSKMQLQQKIDVNFPDSVQITIKSVESWTSNQLKILTRVNYKYKSTYADLRKFLLDRTKELTNKGFLMTLGDIRDVNECEFDGDNNCENSSCKNNYGSFDCTCSKNSIDLSEQIHFLPGSMCVSLQPPNNFRVLNPTPKSLFLRWKYPEIRTVDGVISEVLKGFKMNVSVELRRGHSLSKIANVMKIIKIPEFSQGDEYDTGYDFVNITGLVSSAKYFVRAAAVIGNITGPYSPFQNLVTANQIFI